MLRLSVAAAVRLFFLLCLRRQSTAQGDDSRQCFEVRNETVCYFQPAGGEARNWDAADKLCRDNNATLPVILNSDHQRAIQKYLSQLPPRNALYFTAGRKSWSSDPKYPWHWVNGKRFRRPLSVLGADAIFGCIQFGEALVHNGISSCSFYPGSFICQYPESTCKTLDKATYHQLHDRRHCFVIHDDHLRWYHARNKCIKGGGDLATFDDIDSLIAFHNFTSLTNTYSVFTSYFIGMRRKWWTWRVKESPDIRYTNWPQRRYISLPDDSYGLDCLCLDGIYNFTWMSCDCLGENTILCQSAAEPETDEHHENFQVGSKSNPQTDKFSNVSQCYDISGTRVCYFTPENATRLTFAGAVQWCRDQNSTLPAIRNKLYQESLENFLKAISLPVYLLWTSGVKVKTGIFSWINGQHFQGSSIDDLPNNVSFHLRTRSKETLEQKGRILRSLSVDVKPNSEHTGYICQFPGEFCKTICNCVRTKSDKCLVVSEEKVTWYAARNRCNDFGGALATFEDASEVKELALWLTNYNSYHIGLENSRWIWYQSDKFEDRVIYANWNEDVGLMDFSTAELDADAQCGSKGSHICPRDLENSNFCLCLETFTYKWTPCDCGSTFRFVCQRVELNNESELSIQPNKTGPQLYEMFSNQDNRGSIIAGVEGLIIAVLVISIVFLVVRLRRQHKVVACAELEIPSRVDQVLTGVNAKIPSIQSDYQDLKIYEEIK